MKYSLKNRELEVLASGIKRDGHKKVIRELRNSGIRRDDYISRIKSDWSKLIFNIYLADKQNRHEV